MMGYSTQLLSNHIIGGEITYECKGDGQMLNTRLYTITMKIYRDCQGNGADFDSAPGGAFVASLTIYEDGMLTPYRFDLDDPVVTRVENASDPCLDVPDWVCVEQGVYTIDVELPIVNNSYFIVYQRCCRNGTISNIVDPDRVGATYVTELTAAAQADCNDSPIFTEFPPVVLCAGEDLEFDHSATDAEGDSIVYSFCTPNNGGGPNVNQPFAFEGVAPDPDAPPPYRKVSFIEPIYSETNPLGVEANLAINSRTGIITGRPTTLGQFVLSVCIAEYRNGELLSAIQRDFQLNVTECTPKVTAIIQADSVANGTDFFLTSCGEYDLSFVNESIEEDNIDSLFWQFTLPDSTLMLDSWNASVTFPDAGFYTGQLVLNPGGTCGDTANIAVNISPEIVADFSIDYDSCVADIITLSDASFSENNTLTTWNWNLGDGQTASTTDVDYTYEMPGAYTIRLEVNDQNDCSAVAERQLDYFPLPENIDFEPSITDGCVPQVVQFSNLSNPINETYFVSWDFGDGNVSNSLNPTHQYSESGIYSVTVDVSSPSGCETTAVFEDLIEISPAPTAAFSVTPEQPNFRNRTINLINESLNAAAFEWDFGSITSKEFSPTFTFPDTGFYQVNLVAIHESGCVDSTSQIFDIAPISQLYFPNAFSPNFDGINEQFKPEGILIGARNYNLTIWNRWGALVFSTNNPDIAWNGVDQRTNRVVSEGMYVYLVEFTGARGAPFKYSGNLTLVR